MPDTKTLTLPDSIMADMEKIAQAQKRSVAEVLAEAAQQYIDRQELEETLAFGQRHAKGRGLTPADVAPAIVRVREDRGR